jgi:hypothetical protein
VQVVDEADAAVADKLLDGGDGHLLCLAVFVARAQLSANPPAMSATGAQLPAEPPATSVARGPRAPSLAAVNLSQPSMTRRRSLESVLPRMRNILGNLSITSPGCHTHARACQLSRLTRACTGRELQGCTHLQQRLLAILGYLHVLLVPLLALADVVELVVGGRGSGERALRALRAPAGGRRADREGRTAAKGALLLGVGALRKRLRVELRGV